MSRDETSPAPDGAPKITEWIDYRSVAVAVVHAVADANGCDPLRIPPLQETIDVDTIEGIFADTSTNGDDDTLLSFVHYETRVVICGAGTIVTQPRAN